MERLLRTLSGGRLAREPEDDNRGEGFVGDEPVNLASRIESTLELVWPPPPEAVKPSRSRVVVELPRPSPRLQPVRPAEAEVRAEPAPPALPDPLPEPQLVAVPQPALQAAPPPQPEPQPTSQPALQPVPPPVVAQPVAPQPVEPQPELPVPQTDRPAPEPEAPPGAERRKSARRVASGLAGLVRAVAPHQAQDHGPEAQPTFAGRRLVEAYTSRDAPEAADTE